MPALRGGWSWLEGWRPEAFRGGSRGQLAVGLAFGRAMEITAARRESKVRGRGGGR